MQAVASLAAVAGWRAPVTMPTWLPAREGEETSLLVGGVSPHKTAKGDMLFLSLSLSFSLFLSPSLSSLSFSFFFFSLSLSLFSGFVHFALELGEVGLQVSHKGAGTWVLRRDRGEEGKPERMTGRSVTTSERNSEFLWFLS